jgi:hypothetical protein
MSAITKPLMNFLSLNGISAITKPSHEFLFFTMKCRLSWSLLTNFSFHDGTSEDTVWGKTLFIYITEGIYIGSASLKTLPLDLEPPLQGKEYDPPYSKLSVKSKKNSTETTYRSVVRVFTISRNLNLRKEMSKSKSNCFRNSQG